MEFILHGKTFQAEPLGKCPCGGDIHCSMNPPAVLHGLPYCKAFKEMEPDAFLHYVRQARGIADN